MPNHNNLATVQIDSRVIDRLVAMNDQLHGILDRGELSISNQISLLLDHWQHGSPPAREWIKNQGGLYPCKGRGPSKNSNPSRWTRGSRG